MAATTTARCVRSLEGVLEELEKSIAIIKAKVNGESQQKLSQKYYLDHFSLVYNLCCSREDGLDNARALRKRFVESIESYIAETELPAIRAAQAVGHAEFLAAFKPQRENHALLVRKLSLIFSAANRESDIFHIRREGLLEEGKGIFRTRVFEEMKGDIDAAILALLRQSRGYETNPHVSSISSSVDKSSILDVVAQYEDLGGCLSALREAVMSDTRQYYTSKRSDWISGVGYYANVKSAMEMEQKWFTNIPLLGDCGPKIQSMMEEEMLDKKEVVCMFAENYFKLHKKEPAKDSVSRALLQK